jgi:hypothetical protein
MCVRMRRRRTGRVSVVSCMNINCAGSAERWWTVQVSYCTIQHFNKTVSEIKNAIFEASSIAKNTASFKNKKWCICL